MANRHLSRSIVLQSLYEWDFNNGNLALPLSKIIALNTQEFGPENNDGEYMDALIGGILRMKNEIDEIIVKAAPDWPLQKIACLDRNVLRIGLFELLYGSEYSVPPKVAINEAIELAKQFGGESSGRFVNGVLGSVYRQLGEPGKDQVSKKLKIKDVPYEEMYVEKLAGAVLFTEDKEGIKIGLVFDVFGRWTLVKEDLKEGENHETALKRGLLTKLALDAIEITNTLSENEYIANDPETGKTRKQVTYFLVKTRPYELNINQSKGLQDARWFRIDEIAPLNFYDDLLPVIKKAIELISS
jgi:N utilization substance protein B